MGAAGRSQWGEPDSQGPYSPGADGSVPHGSQGFTPFSPGAPGVRHDGFGTGAAPLGSRWIPAVDVMPVSHTLLFWEGVSSANSPGCHCWDLIRFLWLCLIFIQTVIPLPEASMCRLALVGAAWGLWGSQHHSWDIQHLSGCSNGIPCISQSLMMPPCPVPTGHLLCDSHSQDRPRG